MFTHNRGLEPAPGSQCSIEGSGFPAANSRSQVPAAFTPWALLAAIILSLASARQALAGVATIPTVGLATASMAVGAVGTGGAVAGGGGGGWGSFWLGLGSVGTVILDPPPATYFEGKIVITYPADLLAFVGAGWFGSFALDPSLPIPPVSLTGFLDTGGTGYDLWQPPRPGMATSISDSAGVLTLTFDASPDGIPVDSTGHFNFVNLMFQNISGSPLRWAGTAPGGPANFFQNPSAQIMTCIPGPSYQVPVTCGDGVHRPYQITPTPEPGTLWLLLPIGLLGAAHWRRASGRLRFTTGTCADPEADQVSRRFGLAAALAGRNQCSIG